MGHDLIRLTLLPALFISLFSCSSGEILPHRDLKKIKSLGLLLTGFDVPSFYYGTLDQPIEVASLTGLAVQNQSDKQVLREFKVPQAALSLKKRFAEMLAVNLHRKIGALEVLEGSSAPFSFKADGVDALPGSRKIDLRGLTFARPVDAILVVTPETACSDRNWSVHPQAILTAEFPFFAGNAKLKAGHRTSNWIWCSKTYLFSAETGRELGYFPSAHQRRVDFRRDLSNPSRFRAEDVKKLNSESNFLLDAYFTDLFKTLF